MLVSTENTPLCPVQTGPLINPAHAANVAAADRLHKSLFMDSEGALTAESERIYFSAITPNFMRLYRESWNGGKQVVTSWYFRCEVCGFVLPATVTAGTA